MTTSATISAAGDLIAADTGDERTLTYRLLPFGEPGRTSAGLVTAAAGTVHVPEDIASVTLNLEHDFTRPVARASKITQTPEGLEAEFVVARTTAGDDLLVEAREGLRRGVSVELAEPVIRAGRLISATLRAAAAVVRPAFPSATLTAADTNPDPDPDDADSDESDEDTDPTDQEDTMTDTTTAPPEATDEDQSQAPPATAPAALTASRRARTTPPAPGVRDVAEMLASVAGRRASAETAALLASETVAGPEQLFAALSDVKYDGTGGIATTTNVPQWIGELWSGKQFQRKVIPHFNHAPLTDMVVKGWKWDVKPTMGAWAGNKTSVPSNSPTVTPYEVTAQRIAGAHDHAREFRDFPNPEYWAGYFRAMTESYAHLSDDGVLEDVLTAATAVTRGTVPTGIDPGLVSIVDGALAVLEVGTPSVAFVAPDVWRSVLLTPKDKTLEYLSSSLSLEEGAVENFRIVPHSDITAGEVLVGCREAATVHELAGSPIRAEGLDMVKGGIDTGLFGYYATRIDEPEGLAHVTPPAAG